MFDELYAIMFILFCFIVQIVIGVWYLHKAIIGMRAAVKDLHDIFEKHV